MKDNLNQQHLQAENNKSFQKCLDPRGVHKRQHPRIGIITTFQQSGILKSMPDGTVRALEETHARIRTAIIHRRPIAALHRGSKRLLCPHLLGWNKHRRRQVLCYQYGGDSITGLEPAGSPDNWRCLALENLSQLELLEATWQTAENHSRPQTCIEQVELDVDDYPQPLPPVPSSSPKSAKD